jgi:hypothetical protein
MTPVTVRKRIVETMAKAQHTTMEDMERMVRSGSVALVADRFLDLIGRTLGSGAIRILDQFYHDFLGDYSYVAEDHTDGNFAIRFYHPLSESGVEGVQLSFIYEPGIRRYRARLYRVTTHNGALALNLVGTFDLVA